MVGRGSCRLGRWMNSSAMFTVVAAGSVELVPPTVLGTVPMLPGPVWGHISGCTAAHPAQVAPIQHIYYFISTQVLFCSKIGLGDISQEMYLMHILHAAAEQGKNCMFWW